MNKWNMAIVIAVSVAALVLEELGIVSNLVFNQAALAIMCVNLFFSEQLVATVLIEIIFVFGLTTSLFGLLDNETTSLLVLLSLVYFYLSYFFRKLTKYEDSNRRYS
jgi:hypothetical protein